MRSNPPPGSATASAEVLSRTAMTTRSGQTLVTCTPWTCVMVRTRPATRAVLTRISGVPDRTPATARTSDSGTRRVPVTTTERTANRLESSSAQATPPAMPIAASTSSTASRWRNRWGPPARSPVPPPDGLDQQRSERGDVPGPHGQHHVARLGDPHDRRRDLGPVGQEQGPPAGDGVGDEPARDARFRILACGVDVEDDRLVGQAQRRAEVGGEDPRPAVQMRLENGDDPAIWGSVGSGGGDPPVPPRAFGDNVSRGTQVGGQLGGVMGVAVEDAYAVRLALELQPAPRA